VFPDVSLTDTINQAFPGFFLIAICLRMFAILFNPIGIPFPMVHYLIAFMMIFRKSEHFKRCTGGCDLINHRGNTAVFRVRETIVTYHVTSCSKQVFQTCITFNIDVYVAKV